MSGNPSNRALDWTRTMTLEQVRGMRDVLEVVDTERHRQHAKWGEQNHPDGTGAQFAFDAMHAREWCDQRFAQGDGAWADIFREEVCEALAEEDPAKLREELIQVAAVAVAWVEAIDRRAR